MSEAMEIGPGLFAYKIDDGADHWVVAKDAADAKALVLEVMFDGEMPEEWDEVEVYALDAATLARTAFHSDDGVPVSMLVEMRRLTERRYVACSEY